MSGLPVRSRVAGAIRRVVIVTCSTERQSQAVEGELRARASAGCFDDTPTLLFACPDPSSARVGSGGATFNALITAQELVGKQADCDFESCLVLLIHSGGDSQRLPLQSVCGKAWSALPVFSDRLELQAPVDLLIETLTTLFRGVKAGVVVASSDVLLLIPESFRVDWPQEGATGLAIPSPKALGPNHGVYHVAALPGDGAASMHVPVERFFQKATVDELAAAGAVSPAGEVLLDSGVIYFSPPATSTLLELAQTAPVLSCTYLGVDTATRPLRVELYSDLLLAMSGGLGQTFAQFHDMDTADLNPDRIAAARGLLWRDLSPMPLFAAVAQGGTFLHVGTTPEYRSLLTEPTPPTAALGLRRWAACFDRSSARSMTSVSSGGSKSSAGEAAPLGGMCSLNSVFESAGERGDGAFAEHCVLRGDWSLGAGAIASGVRTVEHLRLRPGFAVQESFVAEPADWAPLDDVYAREDEEEEAEEEAALDGDADDDGASRGSGEPFESPVAAALGAAAAAAAGGRSLAPRISAPRARAGSQPASGDGVTGRSSVERALASPQHAPLVEAELRVISVLHVDDPIKKQWRDAGARVCGVGWDEFMRAAGVEEADVWPAHVPEAARTLWTARLFPVDRPSHGVGRCSGDDVMSPTAPLPSALATPAARAEMPEVDAASLWLQDVAAAGAGRWGDCEAASPAAIARWRASERLSLKDLLARADARAEFAWRRRLRGEVDARLVVEAVRRRSDAALSVLLSRLGSCEGGGAAAPGAAAGLELVHRALWGLDRLAKGRALDVAARAVAIQSALLWAVAGWGGSAQRSGPAAHPDFAEPLALLEGLQPGQSGGTGRSPQHQACGGITGRATKSSGLSAVSARRRAIRQLAAVRDSWLTGSHLIGRAARHLERAAQLLTAQCVYTAPIGRPLALGADGAADGTLPAADDCKSGARPRRGPLAEVVPGAAPLPVGKWATAVCPARVDLAGGWSDTPPIHFEAGPVDRDAGTATAGLDAASCAAAAGTSVAAKVASFASRGGGLVINAGVLVDGKKSVGARARRCAEPHIVIRTRSASRPDEATAAFRGAPASGLLEDSDASASGIPGFVLSEVRCVSLCDVADYFKPTARGALVKSALLCLGVLEIPGRAEGELLDCDGRVATEDSEGALEAQLRACFGGGGLEVETWSQLPQGSGLGVSSILAAAVLAAVSRCAGVRFSNASLTHLVLTLEQLLSTGGGYQDQVGGLYGGVQASVCAPGLPVRVEAFSLDDGAESAATGGARSELASFLDGHLFVMYTGISRLAKNLLQRVLRQWALRENGVTSTVAALRLNAVAMARALADKDAAQVGRCLETYWEQKKLMAPDAEPERVAKLREVMRPFVHGSSLCGAGGGGFLVAVKRPDVSLAHLRQVLKADPRTETLQWTVHTASIAPTGLDVRV
ncbi:hypothetical protein FNF27_00458 [Cafeteria roenbergensis]|uniref:L-fucokinase domain-containing protein n=2 Tax=Cafeteria roenbergensis TaxID=33653 RepID=A0A5A8EPJ8_CAFRO|nr:hypothetical protein FNF27_00458 [Cafeteria roenbergensis]